MAPLLNEAVAANAAGHITDHDLIAHVINETFAVVAAAPASGGTYAPDVAAGATHALTLPSGGSAVTIGAATSSAAAAMPKYLPGQELTIALTQQASPCAGVAWDVSYVNAPAVAPVPGQVTVARFVNIGSATAPTWLCTNRGGPTPCTSATRPTVGLVVGNTMIFETDTGDLKVWTAAGWRTIPVTDAAGLTLDALGGVATLVGSDIQYAANGGAARTAPRGLLEIVALGNAATPTTLNQTAVVATTGAYQVQPGHVLKFTVQCFDWLVSGTQSANERWVLALAESAGTATGSLLPPAAAPQGGATWWTSSNIGIGGAQPGAIVFGWECTVAGTATFQLKTSHAQGTAATTGSFNGGSVLVEHIGSA